MINPDFLKGRSAIVTGSTSGIGLTIAEGLCQAGANVMINGFGDKQEIEKLLKDLQKKHSSKIIYSAADVSKSSEIQIMAQEASEAFGHVDILVNNAGIQYVAPVQEFPLEKWDAIIAINLSAAYKLARETLPSMIEQNWGRIINIASAHGIVASPFKSAYVAAKHGLVGLTKVIALETAEKSITCNAICPGYVKTPLVEKQIKDQAIVHSISEDRVIKEVLLKAQPNKQFIAAEHLSDMVLFLCSESGKGVTGSVLAMDGGWTAQ